MEKYALNEKLVYREEDGVLFSIENMEIYELDDLSKEIISYISNNSSISMNELKDFYISIQDIDVDYFIEFFDQLLDLNLITKQS